MKCSRDRSAGMSKSNRRVAHKWKGKRRGTFPAEGCAVIDLCRIHLILTMITFLAQLVNLSRESEAEDK